MPDGGNLDPRTIEDITSEVRRFGDDFSAMRDSMQADLTSLRDLVNETKGAIGPEIQAQIDKLAGVVSAKQERMESGFASRLTSVETRINRIGMGGGTEDDQKWRAAARDWHAMTMAARGRLDPGQVVDPDAVPYDDIRSYAAAYPKFLRRDEKLLTADEYKALQTGSDPDGGYWVQPSMLNRIIGKVWETSPMRQLASVTTIGTDSLEVPNDFGEFGAGWVGERETRAETTTSQTGLQRIPVHEMYAEPHATQKVLEDASIDVEGYIAGKIADKFGRTEATAFFTGDGINKPRGLLTYASGTTLPGTIEQIASGSATTVTGDSFINVMAALKEPYQAGARWLMRRASIGTVMTLKDQNNRYLWLASLSAGHPSTILGYPVTFAADMPAIAGSALPVAFGNFAEAYQIVDRLGITTIRDPYTAKPFVKFYTRRRVGGDVVNFEAVKLMVIST